MFVSSLAMTSALLLAGAPAPADVLNPKLTDGLGIHGSVLVRLEGIDNQFRPNLPRNDALLTFRTDVHFSYGLGPVSAGVEIIDSRAYFARERSSEGTGEVNTLEPVQAYLKGDLGDVIAPRSTLAVQAGRYIMELGSKRLVAGQTTRNTANGYTGAKIDWIGRWKDKATLFWAMPQTRLPNDPDSIRANNFEFDRESADVQFFGGSFTKAEVAGGTLEMYAYRLHERDDRRQASRNRRLVTPGARLFRAPTAGGADYDLEFAYQFGKTRATAAASDMRDLDVSAYFAHADLGLTFAGDWSPRIALTYDRGSGDRKDASTYNRFDTLYGSRRSDYGPVGLYGPLQRSNLSSPGIRLEVKPDTDTDSFIAYRALRLDTTRDAFGATEVRDRTGGSGRSAGHQIEGRVRHWFVPKTLRVDTGAAYLIKGRFLREAPNAPLYGDTAYGYMDVAYEF